MRNPAVRDSRQESSGKWKRSSSFILPDVPGYRQALTLSVQYPFLWILFH